MVSLLTHICITRPQWVDGDIFKLLSLCDMQLLPDIIVHNSVSYIRSTKWRCSINQRINQAGCLVSYIKIIRSILRWVWQTPTPVRKKKAVLTIWTLFRKINYSHLPYINEVAGSNVFAQGGISIYPLFVKKTQDLIHIMLTQFEEDCPIRRYLRQGYLIKCHRTRPFVSPNSANVDFNSWFTDWQTYRQTSKYINE